MREQARERPLEYPYYEETVTESTWHFDAIQYLEWTLKRRYAQRDNVFVGANNFVYQEEGNTADKQSPDVYVCFRARNQGRKCYKPWEEGGIYPQVIFEVSSIPTRFHDVGFKRELYAVMGVEEYYVFDPLREYMSQGLRAFRRRGEALEELPLAGAPEDRIRVYSPRFDLDLGLQGSLLRFYERGTQEALPTGPEALALAEAASLRASEAVLQAEQATLQAEQATLQTAHERRRAEEAEREVSRLRAEIERLRNPSS